MPRNPSPNAGTPTNRVRVTPGSLERDEKLEEALRLRRYGFNYQQIADTPWPKGNTEGKTLYNGDRHNCRRAIVDARNDTIREAADEVRQYEIDRLDMMWVGLVDAGVFDGNIDAVKAGLSLQARRAKLLGLDAPTEINQRGGGTVQLVVDGNAVKTGMDEATLEVDE